MVSLNISVGGVIMFFSYKYHHTHTEVFCTKHLCLYITKNIILLIIEIAETLLCVAIAANRIYVIPLRPNMCYVRK